MSLEEICSLNIQSITADKAILFLWVPNPKLVEALQVIESWGFTYLTNMVWVKDKIGMGYYSRQKHELLLIAKKGNYQTPEESTRPESVIFAPRTVHSKKPEIVYELIEKMYPSAKKIELFARAKREGWNVWGAEDDAL
jgi:N6-adenosine-specific RNA methylase IME4